MIFRYDISNWSEINIITELNVNKGTFFKNVSEKQNKNLLNTAQTCHSCVKIGRYIECFIVTA